MKMAYGTYAMPTVPLEEALPGLAQMGYDGVEICIGPEHTGAQVETLTPQRRQVLRELLAEHSLGVPALFLLGSLYTPDPEQHEKNMAHVRACAQLGRDLGLADDATPVIAVGLGGKRDDWETIRDDMVRLLEDYARLAEEEDIVVAGEAHCNAAVDRSERAVWLFERVGSPRVRMHFDIVHMFLAGEDVEEAVRTLVPYTAHTHITDAIRHDDGSFELVLLGQGQLDGVKYVRAMYEASWNDFITLEVSRMVWGKEGYDPWAAAQWCYDELSRCFAEAGVPRG
ncbi:MAG: sugar phosphate isomerase/epimerase [Armatimonadetes bacterium]|nr:sugar phosphate isomerase/epimerase [Armatimonadota bacterium]